ncbi:MULTISPECIES: amidohydrolase [Microbacterium]|uniref:amidohydrolase n=1 Tax=Microbacterium TaxID=33882 RepID=UPI00300DFD2A
MALDPVALAALDRIAGRRGGLPLAVRAHWFVHNTGDDEENLAQVRRAVELSQRTDAPWLRVVGIKLILDGVIDACTAALRAPYTNGANADPIWPLDRLIPVVTAADAAGLQIAMHAIGDRASDIALDTLEAAVARNGARERRHRIEHLEYAAPETPARMAKLGVTASMQPVHADPSIWENWAAMLGPERAARGFAWPEYVDAGVRLAFSTDAPTAPHPALANMFIAATRRSAADPSLPPVLPHFALPLEQAIVHGTRDAAASLGEEHLRGSLAAGMRADFAVLDRDPFALGPDALLAASVVRTVVGGRTVHVIGT